MRGARVVATVSSAIKAEIARRAGADDVVIYTQQDFAPEARRLTGDRGVDEDRIGLEVARARDGRAGKSGRARKAKGA